MATLLSPSDIFATSFEPHVSNRWIMYVDGIPSFLIYMTGFPDYDTDDLTIQHINTYFNISGKRKWNDIVVTLYDAIVPSGAQAVMEWSRLASESVTGRNGYSDFYKKSITLDALGPVGDITQEWILNGAFIKKANFGEGNWGEGGKTRDIKMTIRYDFATLNF